MTQLGQQMENALSFIRRLEYDPDMRAFDAKLKKIARTNSAPDTTGKTKRK